MWMVVDGDVYNMSKFARLHPGGEVVLTPYMGKDATEAFFGLHRIEVLQKYARLRVGRLASAGPKSIADTYKLSDASKVPYAEASYLQGFKSAYYTESHKQFRQALADVALTHLRPPPGATQAGKYPPMEMYKKMGQAGINACLLGPGPWMKLLPELGITLPGGLDPEKFDRFHELAMHENAGKLGNMAWADGLAAGLVIGLPVVMQFGSPELSRKVGMEVMGGDKRICLAISEPFAGSDVAGMMTTAKKTKDGKHFVVNGVKKWITNGMFADYFVTAVRTGVKGMFGISMLLIPRGEGVKTTQIHTSYGSSAGTAYVEFKNVHVPVSNMLGKQNQGFRLIMHNFNHERWTIAAQIVGSTRQVISDCIMWCKQRKAFGKPLMSQPVIRQKLGMMIAGTEAVENWLENLTFQMNSMSPEEATGKLASPISLIKLQATRNAFMVADHAAQVLGGRAITAYGGMGDKVEAFLRSIKYAAIYGGSEEIMADLGVKLALKDYPEDARL